MGDQAGVRKFKLDFGATEVPSPIGVKRISRIGSCLHRIRSFVRR